MPLLTQQARHALIFAMGTFSCGLWSCNSKQEPTVNKILIGYIADLEAPEATQARTSQILLAVRGFNDAGGIELDNEKYTVDLVVEDHGQTPEGVVAAVRRLSEQGVTAAVGPNWSSLVLGEEADHSDGAAVAASEHGVVLISGSATAAAIADIDDNGYFFRTAASDTVQAAVAASHLYDSGARSAGVLFRDDAWGAALADAFTEGFEKLGGSARYKVSFSPDADLDVYDFTAQLDDVFTDLPEIIYIISFDEFFEITNQIVAGGYLDAYGNNPPIFFGADGVFSEDLVTNVPTDILRRLEGTVGDLDGTSADYAALRQLNEAEGFSPDNLDAARFDAAVLIMLAIQAGGSTDAESIKSQLIAVSRAEEGDVEIHVGDWKEALSELQAGGTVNYEGASGTIEFSEQGDRTEGVVTVWKAIEESGKYTIDGSSLVVPYDL